MNPTKEAIIDLERRFQIISNTLFYIIENNPNLKHPDALDIKELSEKAETFAKDKYDSI